MIRRGYKNISCLAVTFPKKFREVRLDFDRVLANSDSKEEWSLHYYYDAGWDSSQRGDNKLPMSPFSDEGLAFSLGYLSNRFRDAEDGSINRPISWREGVYETKVEQPISFSRTVRK